MNHLLNGYYNVRQRLAQTGATDVTLIAVTKNQLEPAVLPLLEAGQRDFAENRVQEAAGKWPSICRRVPCTLHLIGSLQTNKAAQAVALFDVIHTLDRPKLAEALAVEITRQNRKISLFIQLNTGEEPQKGGILPQDADAFIKYCTQDLGLPVIGLMCIPPEQECAGLHFALLAGYARRHNLGCLSMGMSRDWELAIALGATHIRLGSALFTAGGGLAADSDGPAASGPITNPPG